MNDTPEADEGRFMSLSFARTGIDTTEQIVLVGVALMPIAWAPLFVQSGAPRVAVALALLPLGMVKLVQTAYRRDLASRLALSLIVVAVVSSLSSPAPLNSILGTLDWWTGTIGLTAALAWWAIGRDLSMHARDLLVPALTIGAVWNVLIAAAQVAFDIDVGVLGAPNGRGTGTMLNPVYFGAFTSGIFACWVTRPTRARRLDGAIILVLAFGVGLSGGRVALAVVVLSAVAALMVAENRRGAAINAVLAAAGVYAATLEVGVRDSGRTVIARTIGESSNSSGRMEIWRIALDAFAERPLFGWGPGNVELATERQFDLSYTTERLTDFGSLDRWLDTHNVVLDMLVGTGLVGLAVAVAFVVVAGRRFACAWGSPSHRVLLVGALAMAMNWMLQPRTIHTFPIALLLFGASMGFARRQGVNETPEELDDASVHLGADLRAITAGVALAVLLLANMFVIDRSLKSGRLDLADFTARHGYSDPFVDLEIANAYWLSILDRDRDEMLGKADQFARRSLAKYPAFVVYERVGEIEFARGNLNEAKAAEQKALTLQPWNPIAHRRMLVLAEATDDSAAFEASMRALCALGVEACETDSSVPASGVRSDP